MPTSDHHNISPILTVLLNLNPRSVLDIGCGFGKYGMLLREFLDVWNGRYFKDEWSTHIEAIEAFPSYLTPIHDFVYSKVHVGEAHQVLPTLGKFDAILIADVIEHFAKAQAVSLVQECLRHSSVIVISTPKEFYPQQDTFGNPHEVHRCLWTVSDFPASIFVRTIESVYCRILVASSSPISASALWGTDPADQLRQRARQKLGIAGRPASLLLRILFRLLT